MIAKATLWAVPAVALLMLGLTLTPAEVWRAPAVDAVYTGFDPNLQYTTDGGGGGVRISRDAVDLTAPANSQPAINLATTPLHKLNAKVDVTVVANDQRSQAFRIGYWSPWTRAGYFVVFGPAPAYGITTNAIAEGGAGPTLIGGNVISSAPLGKYRLGDTYQVEMLLDRDTKSVLVRISGPGVSTAEATVNSSQFPAFFGAGEMSLTASASSTGTPVSVTLGNFVLTLPHARLWAVKINDPVATSALIALAIAGGLLVVVAVFAALRREGAGLLRLRRPRLRWAWLLVVGAIGIYLAGNALLFPLKGHPFDFGDEELYAYVARAYGPAHLYYLPNVVSLAGIWRGVPYLENAFPYEPVVAYLFAGIGWFTSALFAGGGVFARDSLQLGYVTKSVNVLFGLGDAALIYLVLRQINVSRAWSWIASALFLFNPAVWFSMSVWGQTHVVSLFFVLAAVLFAEKHLPVWAWLALAAACLTRPQMLVLGIVLGIVFLRKFSWRENVSALSWTVIVSFITWLPLTLATSPSLPVDIMLNNFHVQETGGNLAVLTTVSQDAYSLWPLVTFVVHGASGIQRAFTASSTPLIGSFTYQQVSQVLTLAAMVLVGAALAARKRASLAAGGYLPLVALSITSFLMLLTGLVATHFLLALPFLLLCRRWMSIVAFFYIAAIWTVSTLVPMLGEMAIAVPHQQWPFLAAQSDAINNFMVQVYASDRFITTAIVANVCAVIWLAFVAFRRSSKSPEMLVATPG
jgi:hypothetical protein